MNRNEGWLAVESCDYADFREAEASGERLQEVLLIAAAKRKVGVQFYLRGAVKAINIYPAGLFELRDPGLPLPTTLSDQELKEMIGAAVESATSLTANQRVAAELLNDSFFKMSPEASFLLRVSAVEALCPQADQTDDFKNAVGGLLASIPKKHTECTSRSDRAGFKEAGGEAVRTQRVYVEDQPTARRKFEALYGLRSNFLHDGTGRGTLGDAAHGAFEIGLELLLADIAHSTPMPPEAPRMQLPTARSVVWLIVAFSAFFRTRLSRVPINLKFARSTLSALPPKSQQATSENRV